jgi:hypothetical protein
MGRARYVVGRAQLKGQTMIVDNQVLYLGRWVSREHFKAFVYNSTGEKLANDYDEFSEMISSGTWFAEKSDIPALHKESNIVLIKQKKRANKCQNLNKA